MYVKSLENEPSPLISGDSCLISFDINLGITAAYAIASALFRRQVTGEGQFLDVAMLDSALTQLGPLIANYTVAGEEPKLNGNASLTGLACYRE